MILQNKYISDSDLQEMFELFADYEVPVSLKYAAMLAGINERIEAAKIAVEEIPDCVNTYDDETYEETVKIWEPCPPSEFFDSSFRDELELLFYDIVGNEISETLKQMNDEEYWEYCDCSKKIKEAIKYYFDSIKYSNSYGICDYYDIRFKFPPVANFCDYDDPVEAVTDEERLHKLVQDIAFLIKIIPRFASKIADVPDAEEAEKLFLGFLKEHSCGIKRTIIDDLRAGKSTINTTEEYVAAIVNSTADLLWQELDLLKKITEIATKANEEYKTIFDAVEYVCKEFSRLAKSIGDYYEKLENWREFFEANEMNDVLEELFGTECRAIEK